MRSIAARLHPALEGVLVQGRTEIETLNDDAAKSLQKESFFGGFDAFRQNFDPEGLADAQDRFHENAITIAIRKARDETAIDLDPIDAHPAQVGNGRITCAEIIDRQADSDSRQGRQRREPVFAGGEGLFRDFHFKAPAIDAVLVDRASHQSGQIIKNQLVWRNVDRDQDVVVTIIVEPAEKFMRFF